jgi:hypothetical protein
MTLPILCRLQGPYDAFTILGKSSISWFYMLDALNWRDSCYCYTHPMTNEETGSRLTYDSQIDLKGLLPLLEAPFSGSLQAYALKIFTNLDEELMKLP